MFQSKIYSQSINTSLLPHISNVVKTYVSAATKMIDSPVDFSNFGLSLINSGCLLLPEAEIVITGTRCAAPMVQNEAQVVATMLQCSALLLRCEGAKGISFDIYQPHRGRWLTEYRFWVRGHELWLIPAEASQPCFQIVTGINERHHLPFTDSDSKDQGFERAQSTFSSLVRRSI